MLEIPCRGDQQEAVHKFVANRSNMGHAPFKSGGYDDFRKQAGPQAACFPEKESPFSTSLLLIPF